MIGEQEHRRKSSEYMMLLALYAKWCRTLEEKAANAPNMGFIAFDLLET